MTREELAGLRHRLATSPAISGALQPLYEVVDALLAGLEGEGDARGQAEAWQVHERVLAEARAERARLRASEGPCPVPPPPGVGRLEAWQA